MQKLLGVEMGRVRTSSFNIFLLNQIQVWLCWTIFAIKIVCAPLNLIFGGVFYNESSEEPHLPPLMIAGGLLEVGLARLSLGKPSFKKYWNFMKKFHKGGGGQPDFISLIQKLLSLSNHPYFKDPHILG